MNRTCQHCRWWGYTGCNDEYCRRNAPIIVVPKVVEGYPPWTAWPRTRASEFCGQWEAKPDAVAADDSRSSTGAMAQPRPAVLYERALASLMLAYDEDRTFVENHLKNEIHWDWQRVASEELWQEQCPLA